MKRILVIRGGAIGDFILTLPALKLLRERWPEARLEILGYKHIVALAENRFYAHATRSIEYSALAGFFAKRAELDRELSDYFASFDLVVSYLFDPDEIFEQNLRRSGVEMLVGCSPQIGAGKHAAAQLAECLTQIELTLPDPAARIYPSAGDLEFAARWFATADKPLCAIHPGSGSAKKNWPLKRWLELGNLLLQNNDVASLLVIGGEADEQQLATLKSSWGNNARVRFAERIPLPQLAGMLASCAIFIGHDSGISHLAAAVEAPCVLLFGPTNPAVWAPANRGVEILRPASDQLADLSLQEVRDAVLQTLTGRVGSSARN